MSGQTGGYLETSEVTEDTPTTEWSRGVQFRPCQALVRGWITQKSEQMVWMPICDLYVARDQGQTPVRGAQAQRAGLYGELPKAVPARP